MHNKDLLFKLSGVFCLIWWGGIAYYWIDAGMPVHLLWLCDIALPLVGLSLIINNRVILSSQVLGTLVIQLLWLIDFIPSLIFKTKLFGWTSYMFNPDHPSILKFLSLFHVFLPFLMIAALLQYSYDKRGLILQSIITAVVYIFSFIFTTVEDNTNWVLGPFWKIQEMMNPIVYLLVFYILTLILYLCSHFVLLKIFKNTNKQFAE